MSEAAGRNVVDSSASSSDDSDSDDDRFHVLDIDLVGDPMGPTETDDLMHGFDKLKLGQAPRAQHPSTSSELMKALREAPPVPGFRQEGEGGGALQRYASLAAGI